MKKSIFMMFLMILCLTGCGKSEAVKSAEAAIAAIGEVDYDSQAKIEEAEKCYEILTDAEKEKVENRRELVDAREAFDNLPPNFSDDEIAALFALYAMKEGLRNPDSLVLNSISGGRSKDDSNIFKIDYSAQNGFGGMGNGILYIEVSRRENGFSVKKWGSPDLFNKDNQYYTSLRYAEVAAIEFDAKYLSEHIDNIWDYIE